MSCLPIFLPCQMMHPFIIWAYLGTAAAYPGTAAAYLGAEVAYLGAAVYFLGAAAAYLCHAATYLGEMKIKLSPVGNKSWSKLGKTT